MIDGTFGRAAVASGRDIDEVADMVRRQIPLRRFADPTDIASAVSFLVGPEASYITGQILSVDGGTALV
jgi:NAD(P)-dependent dehydrogenase (short-subunit alcohol dehydrogenase family)